MCFGHEVGPRRYYVECAFPSLWNKNEKLIRRLRIFVNTLFWIFLYPLNLHFLLANANWLFFFINLWSQIRALSYHLIYAIHIRSLFLCFANSKVSSIRVLKNKNMKSKFELEVENRLGLTLDELRLNKLELCLSCLTLLQLDLD